MSMGHVRRMCGVMSSADDELVWSLSTGSILTCKRDVVMEGTGEVAYTAGQCYRVESMHPVADPPFVRTLDDQGQPHALRAADLRDYFGR